MNKIAKVSFSFLAVVALGIGFVGCGGDDDGDSSSSSIVFPSDAVVAEPTPENAEEVKAVAADDIYSQTAGSMPLLSVENTSNGISLGTLSGQIAQNIATSLKGSDVLNQYALNETIDETVDCYSGGTISYKGSADDSSAEIVMSADQCDYSGFIMDGDMKLTVKGYNETEETFDYMSVEYLTDFKADTLTISKGSYEIISDIQGYMESFKLNISMIASMGEEKFGVDDCEYYYATSGSEYSIYQTKGRMYIDNLTSYVDYDTAYDMSQTPFVYSYSSVLSGEAHYIMAGGANIKVTANDGVVTYAVDSDGDGTYDLVEE